MKQYIGWLFDLYAHTKGGVVLWLLCDDGSRQFFYQDFKTVFYARSASPRLRELWIFLRENKYVKLEKDNREDLFDGFQDVLKATVASPHLHDQIVQDAQKQFPDLIFYDVDVPLELRYYAEFNVFSLARCQVTVENNKVINIKALDSATDIDPLQPPLRKLFIKPNVNPFHKQPKYLLIKYEGFKYKVELNKPREVLSLINSIFRSYNPDVILTRYGDIWLFAHLEEISKQTGIPFQPNRDLFQGVIKKKPISFVNYGRAHYMSEQVHLLGRWHIDVMNCMAYSHFGFIGALELSRMTGLPVQQAARRSPGAGVSAMQTLTALHRGVLVPYQHQQGEVPKTYDQLFKSDRGGLIYEPLLGVFNHVAVLDFMMMFPSIICEYNISPETVAVNEANTWEIPVLGVEVSNRRGLVPDAVQPMRDKRMELKRRLKSMKKDDPKYKLYKAQSDAIKDLGVVTNGRLGFANSIFGRINSHEALSFISRKLVLEAKSIAEDHGFTVIHIYVDSLMLYKEGATTVDDYKEVMQEIAEVVKLPIDIEDVFSWMAFVSSAEDPEIPVSNRFFGRGSDGELKIRGLAQRRRDTCLFVKNLQMEVLNILALETDARKLFQLIPNLIEIAKKRISELKRGEVPIRELVITRTLSKEIHEYKTDGAHVRVAKQLEIVGKILRKGQNVRYILTKGKQESLAWELCNGKGFIIDVKEYQKLIMRAIYEVTQPLGVTKQLLKNWIIDEASYIALQDFPLFAQHTGDMNYPIFAVKKQQLAFDS